MMRGARRRAASFVLGTLLFVASPVLGQGGRTLADWPRDLRDPAVDVRARAVQGLVAFDRRAVPALTGALGDREFRVRASAAEALVKLPPGHVVPGMIAPTPPSCWAPSGRRQSSPSRPSPARSGTPTNE
jgi:hypothetical protein